MVTGSSDFSGQNFGLDKLPEHDTRYDMAAEYIDVVTKLWESWEPGAIVADRKTGVLIDPAKVHTIDHKGEFYASRGPLNSGPCPQGRPVIAQAGGSAKGRAIAAQYADTVVAHPKGVAAMKEYRDDVRARMVAAGRDPDSCKVLFMATPILANTDEEARARADQRGVASTEEVNRRLAQMGWTTNIDFSGYDLDAPVGDLTTNGHQSSLANFMKKAGGRTLREAILAYTSHGGSVDLVGTPETVAAQMDEAMQEVGGDGFLLVLPNVSRKTVVEITDGLVPALQQRGLVRREYGHKQFRDNLLEF
jgi:FMN-dependent oxidoreductase (nitrilotriacetate monooxygenase family)